MFVRIRSFSAVHVLMHARACGVEAARLSQWLATVYVLARARLIINALPAVVWISVLMGISKILTDRNNDLGFIEVAILEYFGTFSFVGVLYGLSVRRLADHVVA